MKNEIILGDCKDYLPLIQDKSIDFVFIDPPYEFDNHGGGANSYFAKSKISKAKHIEFISNGFDMDFVFSQVERVCKTVNMVCFCSNKQVSKIMAYWEAKKYSVTLLIWEKPNAIPMSGGHYVSNIEFMIYVRGKGATYNNLRANENKKTFLFTAPTKRMHPTQKPLGLLERILKIHTKENDVVLDCFAGSFSIVDACKNLNRQYIAIEKEATFYNEAVLRIESKTISIF